jgi:hypothetical protein
VADAICLRRMPARFLSIALLLGGCAGASRDARALRISASHYQSMNGVAVKSGLGPMTCARDTITGSHILHWYCRFAADPSQSQYQLSAPIVFVLR